MSAMSSEFKQFEVVALTRDIPEHGLKAGDTGTVLELLTKPHKAYEVEFIDKDGRTIALVALKSEQLTAAD